MGGGGKLGDLKQEELLEHFTYIRESSYTTIVTKDGEILVLAFGDRNDHAQLE